MDRIDEFNLGILSEAGSIFITHNLCITWFELLPSNELNTAVSFAKKHLESCPVRSDKVTDILKLNVNPRIHGQLKRARGLSSVEGIGKLCVHDLLDIRNFGLRTVLQIGIAIDEFNVDFALCKDNDERIHYQPVFFDPAFYAALELGRTEAKARRKVEENEK